MTTFHEQYSDVESALVRGFCQISSCCSIVCECGRTYFTTASTGGDFSPGELEGLIANEQANPDQYISSNEFDTIDAVSLDGKEFVPQCKCGGVAKYAEWLESNLEQLTKYCATRLEQKRKEHESALSRIRSEQARFKSVRFPVGTRIKFVKRLVGDATGDHPAFLFAEKDSEGEVTGHCNHEGHMVKWDGWPSPFGAMYGAEFVEAPVTK